MAKTFLITGGAGFVGANLAAEIASRDEASRVVILDDFRTGSFRNITAAHARRGLPPFSGSVVPEGIETVEWHDVVAEVAPAAIFHLAAITDTTVTDEAEMLAINTEPFVGMRDAAAAFDVPLVYASSAATYGSPAAGSERAPFTEAMAGAPSNVYGFSKWLMECEHRRAHDAAITASDAPNWVVGLRFFNVFGPGENNKAHMASMVHQLAVQLLDGKSPRLFADGSQARDQIPVEDVVDGLLVAAGYPPSTGSADPKGFVKRVGVTPGVYNLGSGRATSFNDIIAAIRRALDLGPAELETEYFEMPGHIRRFYQDFTQADMTAAHAGLRWRPARDPVEHFEALARHLRDARRTAELAST